MKRSRGRGRRSGGGNNNPNRHFESNGPGVKIRGSAQQILDKYQQYARDAQSSGDRVDAENYLQHAEHYYRVLAAMKPPEKPKQEQREGEDKDAATPEGADAASDDNANAKNDNKTDNKNEGKKEPRSRSRRKPRERAEQASDSPEENAEAKTSASDDGPAKEEKPKRRRTYKKAAAADAPDEQDDGIMKTLSRGRKASDGEAVEATAADAD